MRKRTVAQKTHLDGVGAELHLVALVNDELLLNFPWEQSDRMGVSVSACMSEKSI